MCEAIVDRPFSQHDIFDEGEHWSPVIASHRDDREPIDLASRHQVSDLEDLVEGAVAARHQDKGAGVLHELHLSRKGRVELYPAVEVEVHLLLTGKGDGATDREAAGFLGTSIGRLHDAWTAPRDDRVTSLGKPSADRLGELIVTVVLAEPSRPEDCHRRADVVQGPAAPHQLLEDL